MGSLECSEKDFVVVQSLSRVLQLFATPWTAAHQASLSFTVSWRKGLSKPNLDSQLQDPSKFSNLPGVQPEYIQN